MRHSGIIKIHNNSGTDRERYDVLEIDSPVVTPAANEQQFKNEVALEAYEPGKQTSATLLCRQLVVLRDRCGMKGSVAQCSLA